MQNGDDFRYIGAGPVGALICGGLPQDCAYPGQKIAPDLIILPPAPRPPGGPPPAPGAPPPPPRCQVIPPRPPTASWDFAPLTSPDLQLNPAAAGVVGLEQWLWDAAEYGEVSWQQTGIGGVTATCQRIPAPVVTFTAAPVAWYWDAGQPGSDQQSATKGSYQQPAARWTYQTKGYYDVTVIVEWAGAPNGTLGLRDRTTLQVDEIVPQAIG